MESLVSVATDTTKHETVIVGAIRESPLREVIFRVITVWRWGWCWRAGLKPAPVVPSEAFLVFRALGGYWVA